MNERERELWTLNDEGPLFLTEVYGAPTQKVPA